MTDSRFHDFDVDDDEVDEDEAPITFKLKGETFECRPFIPGAVFLRFVREADSGEGGRSADAVLGLFKKVIVDEDFDRFNALLEDPTKRIRMTKLADLASWFVEIYTGNQDGEPKQSSAGRKPRGRT